MGQATDLPEAEQTLGSSLRRRRRGALLLAALIAAWALASCSDDEGSQKISGTAVDSAGQGDVSLQELPPDIE